MEVSNKKDSWFKQVISFPGGLLALIFLFQILIYIRLFSSMEANHGKENKLNITRRLYPFILSIIVILTGFLSSEKNTLYVVDLFACICIVLLVTRTFRFSQNPLSFLNAILTSVLKSEVALLPEIIKTTLNKTSAGEAEVEKEKSPNFSLTIVMVINFFKFLSKISASARIPLGLFLIYYSNALLLTICLFAVMIKIDMQASGRFGFLDYLLASLLRFTSGSTLAEIFGPLVMNPSVLAFESFVSFCYVVLAIMAIGISANQSAMEFQEHLKAVGAREMSALRENLLELLKPNSSPKIAQNIPKEIFFNL